jgi:preprotein translocase subunit SecD
MKARSRGIILDGFLVSAPAIRTTIFGRGEITGQLSRQKVDDLADVLNAGSLPAPMVKVGELLPKAGP